MKLPLDTHIRVWTLVAPERLNSSVSAELVNAANEIWLSPVTVWETMLLIERGRIADAIELIGGFDVHRAVATERSRSP